MNRFSLLNSIVACYLVSSLFPSAVAVAQTQRRSAEALQAAAERASNARHEGVDQAAGERVAIERGANDRGNKEPGTGPKLPLSGRTVSLKFVIAEFVKGVKSPAILELDDADKVLFELKELEAAGEISSPARYTLSSVELSPARLQFGERRPAVSARGGFPGRGGGGAEGPVSYSMESFGTIISSLARVADDGAVLAEITIERSRPALNLSKESESDISRTRSSTTSAQSTVLIPRGKWVVLGSGQGSYNDETTQSIVLVSAQVADPIENKMQVRVFKLSHAEATGLARDVSDILADNTIRIVVDARTNSLVVTSSDRNLQLLADLIQTLDEAK